MKIINKKNINLLNLKIFFFINEILFLENKEANSNKDI
tara:strand:- start:41 stop:154 length:114 start_codon:yes stop_codon:yes gene_type:complete